MVQYTVYRIDTYLLSYANSWPSIEGQENEWSWGQVFAQSVIQEAVGIEFLRYVDS